MSQRETRSYTIKAPVTEKRHISNREVSQVILRGFFHQYLKVECEFIHQMTKCRIYFIYQCRQESFPKEKRLEHSKGAIFNRMGNCEIAGRPFPSLHLMPHTKKPKNQNWLVWEVEKNEHNESSSPCALVFSLEKLPAQLNEPQLAYVRNSLGRNSESSSRDYPARPKTRDHILREQNLGGWHYLCTDIWRASFRQGILEREHPVTLEFKCILQSCALKFAEVICFSSCCTI